RCCAQRLLPLRTPPSTSVTVLRPISCIEHLCPRSSTPQRQRDQILGSLLMAGDSSTGRGMLSSSPIETGSSPDWHPAGLLTHASSNSRYLPGRFAKTQPLRASTQWCYFSNSPRLQLRGSAGFSPASRSPDVQIVYSELAPKSSTIQASTDPQTVCPPLHKRRLRSRLSRCHC